MEKQFLALVVREQADGSFTARSTRGRSMTYRKAMCWSGCFTHPLKVQDALSS